MARLVECSKNEIDALEVLSPLPTEHPTCDFIENNNKGETKCARKHCTVIGMEGKQIRMLTDWLMDGKTDSDRQAGRQTDRQTNIQIELFGRWGHSGEKFLHQISLRSRDEDGKLNLIEFRTYWQRILSITLQRCNSSVFS